MTCDHEAQIRDLLEEREELLTEIVRLQRGNHPAGRALRAVESVGTGAGGETDPATTETTVWDNRSAGCPEDPAQAHALHSAHADNSVVDAFALTEALTERDAEHEGGGGA